MIGSAALLAVGACLGAGIQAAFQLGARGRLGAGDSNLPAAAGARPDHCELAIVGGGVGGLHLALELLDHKLLKPSDICIFERELRFGGRAYDWYWPDEDGNPVGGDLEPVGLGGWRIDQDHNPKVWRSAVERYNMTLRRWQVQGKFREARGKIYSSAEVENGAVRRAAYPVFADGPFGNASVLADLIAQLPPTDESTRVLRGYTDLYDILLAKYGPEAVSYLKEVEFGGFTSSFHDVDPRWSLDMFRMWGSGPSNHFRPVGGGIGNVPRLMTEELSRRGVVRMSVAMAVEKVDRCSDAERRAAGRRGGDCYTVRTSREKTFTASRVAFAVPPLALAKIRGAVPEDLLATPLLRHSYPDVAFKAALLFPHAWWEPIIAANGSTGYLDGISGAGNCLGQVVPYLGRGAKGEAALHVSYVAGDCVALHWRHATGSGMSPSSWEAHLVRQLRVLFPQADIPAPLRSVVKLWDEGAWHMQRRTDPYLTSVEILRASAEPLKGEPVYVVNEAFGLRRGWMEASFESAESVVRLRFLGLPSAWEEGGHEERGGLIVSKATGEVVADAIGGVVASSPPFDLPFTFSGMRAGSASASANRVAVQA
ncbi:hypothetical protein DFJ74DRAFT_697943 [Hyaloraphidium curvatum]|nr:hypothetical protein DFJ74DRAFT_697943 [Hyaloraphidium curvatum]